MKTHAWFSIAFLFLGGWAATVLVSFWVPWILLPDLLMVIFLLSSPLLLFSPVLSLPPSLPP